MRDARPGDLAYVPQGAYLCSAVDNEERWNEKIVAALVIGTAHRFVETDTEVSGLVTIFIAEQGMFLVKELDLMTPDEYADPARLFPHARLREG